MEQNKNIFSWRWQYSIISLLVSIIVGYIFIGWQSGVIWGVIAFHELGHFVVQKKYIDKTSYPIFIPALGALITQKPAHPLVAIAGAAFALPAVIILSLILGEAVKESMVILCIFHMVALAPIVPFDGGWITGNRWWSFLFVLCIPLLIGQYFIAVIFVIALSITWGQNFNISVEKKYMLFWIGIYILWIATIYWAPWQ